MPGPLKWFPTVRPPDQNVVWLYSFLGFDFKLFCEVSRNQVRHIAMKHVKSSTGIWRHSVIFFSALQIYRCLNSIYSYILYSVIKSSKKSMEFFFFKENHRFVFQIYRTECFNLRFHTDSAAVNIWRCRSCLRDRQICLSPAATETLKWLVTANKILSYLI